MRGDLGNALKVKVSMNHGEAIPVTRVLLFMCPNAYFMLQRRDSPLANSGVKTITIFVE